MLPKENWLGARSDLSGPEKISSIKANCHPERSFHISLRQLLAQRAVQERVEGPAVPRHHATQDQSTQADHSAINHPSLLVERVKQAIFARGRVSPAILVLGTRFPSR